MKLILLCFLSCFVIAPRKCFPQASDEIVNDLKNFTSFQVSQTAPKIPITYTVGKREKGKFYGRILI